MTTFTFPIKFKVSNKFLEELKLCEWGRYKDALHARETTTPEEVVKNRYDCVFNDFSDRFKTQIEVRNWAELKELRWVLATGTIDCHMYEATKNLYSKVLYACKRVA